MDDNLEQPPPGVGVFPISSLSKFISPVGQNPSRKVKVKGIWGGWNIMTNRDWAHFLLFRQEKQTKMDNGLERVCPAEKEGGARGAGGQ